MKGWVYLAVRRVAIFLNIEGNRLIFGYFINFNKEKIYKIITQLFHLFSSTLIYTLFILSIYSILFIFLYPNYHLALLTLYIFRLSLIYFCPV